MFIIFIVPLNALIKIGELAHYLLEIALLSNNGLISDIFMLALSVGNFNYFCLLL